MQTRFSTFIQNVNKTSYAILIGIWKGVLRHKLNKSKLTESRIDVYKVYYFSFLHLCIK